MSQSIRIELTNNMKLNRPAIVRALAVSAEYLRSNVVRATPVETGRGRAAWVSRVDPYALRAIISNNTSYLRIVNDGSGLWGPNRQAYPIRPKFKKALAWPGGHVKTAAGLGRGPQGTKKYVGKGKGRRLTSYRSDFTVVKSVMHPGIKPRHFVEKAVDKSRSRVLSIFARELGS